MHGLGRCAQELLGSLSWTLGLKKGAQRRKAAGAGFDLATAAIEARVAIRGALFLMEHHPMEVSVCMPSRFIRRHCRNYAVFDCPLSFLAHLFRTFDLAVNWFVAVQALAPNSHLRVAPPQHGGGWTISAALWPCACNLGRLLDYGVGVCLIV